jgi:hypothetical protein
MSYTSARSTAIKSGYMNDTNMTSRNMSRRRPARTSGVALLSTIGSMILSRTSMASAEELESRVVGGTDASPGQYKYFASWAGGCGASLIHDDILLTAAHVRYIVALCSETHQIFYVPTTYSLCPVCFVLTNLIDLRKLDSHSSQSVQSANRWLVTK